MLSVREFYNGKTIFITGGSGFMGKVLIEKLLYSCSDLKQILILMRPKRGKSGAERVEEFSKIPLFQRVLSEKPEVLKKLVPVFGDITNENLGLSSDDLNLVLRETSIVFHFAASLNFESPLKEALLMNVQGTEVVMNLAKQMKKLVVMAHLSTAFCVPDQEILEERIYEWESKPKQIMQSLEWMDEETVGLLEKKLVGVHPNTYTYTKRLAEILVKDEHEKIPVCIIRPSIVLPTIAEPIPGWVDNLNGPIGLFTAAGKGIVRSILGDSSTHAELMPVDVSTNVIIVFASKVGTLKEKPKEIPVLNLTIKPHIRHTWKAIIDAVSSKALEYPLEMGLWYPSAYMTTSKALHYIHIFFVQWVPAVLLDCLIWLARRDPVLVRMQKKIFKGSKMLQYFTLREWDFQTKQCLIEELNEDEAKIFPTDVFNFDKDEYAKNCMLGVRQFIVKEPLSSLPKSRTQVKIMRVVDIFVQLLRVVFLGWFIKFLLTKFFSL